MGSLSKTFSVYSEVKEWERGNPEPWQFTYFLGVIMGRLPLGWRLEKSGEHEVVYRFNGDSDFLGVHRKLSFPLKVVRILDEFGVFLPRRGEMALVTRYWISEKEARRFILDFMCRFTRRFFGLSRKRGRPFKVVLPQ